MTCRTDSLPSRKLLHGHPSCQPSAVVKWRVFDDYTCSLSLLTPAAAYLNGHRRCWESFRRQGFSRPVGRIEGEDGDLDPDDCLELPISGIWLLMMSRALMAVVNSGMAPLKMAASPVANSRWCRMPRTTQYRTSGRPRWKGSFSP